MIRCIGGPLDGRAQENVGPEFYAFRHTDDAEDWRVIVPVYEQIPPSERQRHGIVAYRKERVGAFGMKPLDVYVYEGVTTVEAAGLIG